MSSAVMATMLPAPTALTYWASALFRGILGPMARIAGPDLIGRIEESRALDAALDAAHAGGTPTVFVTGEAGIGKSRLGGSGETASETLVLGHRGLTG